MWHQANLGQGFEKLAFIISVFAILFLDEVFAVKCYKCSVLPVNPKDNSTSKTQLCSKFDESDAFIVDCPYSTMCLKRVFNLPLVGGKQVETVTRGCANQRYTEQVYKDGSWHKVYTVEEPYEEGCTKNEDGSIYCHCKGKLCNASPRISTQSWILVSLIALGVLKARTLIL